MVNLQCGNGRTDAGESCDFGSKNGTTYADNGFKCNNSCQFVPVENQTCSSPAENLNGPKVSFLYFRSSHLDEGYKLYSIDTAGSKWSINDIKLPDTPNDLMSYGVMDTSADGKHSTLSASELSIGKTNITNFINLVKSSNALTRKHSFFDTIFGGRVQRLTDPVNRVDALSFNLNDILTGGYGARRVGFDHVISLMSGNSLDVLMKDCNGGFTGQGKVNVIGIIDGDNNSLNLMKSYGSLLPANALNLSSFYGVGN